jgi:uncharacterized protein
VPLNTVVACEVSSGNLATIGRWSDLYSARKASASDSGLVYRTVRFAMPPLYLAEARFAPFATRRASQRAEEETHPGPLIIPALVITEVTYLLGTRIGADAEVRFLGDLAAGNLLAESVSASDWMRIAELVASYRNLPFGTADASVIAAAERLGIPDIVTLAHRHFTVVRSTLGDLTLLP